MSNLISVSEKEIEEKVKFLSSAKCNHTPHMYIDITEDLVQGTLLARIMYWFAVDKNKKSKVRIFKDGYFWIAKQRKDWWEEIRITERQYDKAIKELEKKGLIKLAKYKFNSMPTIHIRPDYDNINSATEKWKNKLKEEIVEEYESELQNDTNGNNTKCNSQGNDTKCKTGVTQEGNLLTSITNNDYINNDYKTENTVISPTELNTNKFASSPTGLHTSLSDERKGRGKSKDKWVVTKNHIVSVMDKLGYGELADETQSAIEVFRYYYMMYKQKTGKAHPRLNDKAMTDTLVNFIGSLSEIDCIDCDDYECMIDEHFSNNYGKEIDYSIRHFMNIGILKKLYKRLIY